ncbi:MAG: hypothetical protein Q9160_002053 [Pyrenula sp. 1 TL-2023]
MSSPSGKRRKITHALKKPHEDAEIADLAPEDQQVLLEMLCSLLEPLGTYRAQYIQPSDGKRKKRRQKRTTKKVETTDQWTNAHVDRPPPSPPVPEPPDTSDHVLVGFNVLNRHLEALAAFTTPADPKPQTSEVQTDSQQAPKAPAPVAAIFYPTRDVSTLLTHHLPFLCHLASFNQPNHPAIRLIPLSTPRASEMLSKALHLPRVSFVGILDDSSTPTNGLIEYCREKAIPVKLPWLDGLKRGQYEAVKVKRIETFERQSKKQKLKAGAEKKPKSEKNTKKIKS